MSQPGISFTTSGQTYSVPTTVNQAYSNQTNGAQFQTLNANTTSQVITGQPVYTGGYHNAGNVQRVGGYVNEVAYGSKAVQQGEYGTAATIGRYEGFQQAQGNSYQPVVAGGTYQVGSGNGYVASGATGGSSFTIKPPTVNFGGSRTQATTVTQPVSYVQTAQQPVTTTYVQPVTTTYYQQPATTQYIQPTVTTSYVQPAVTTTYVQPVQQATTSYVAAQPVANQWVEEEFERPKYPKLYNNSAEYYRNLAPEEDPTVKKSCCSPCCWVLWGLLGLLGMLFGILCGLGILCGGGFSLGVPSISAPSINIPKPDINIPKPDINLPDINIPKPDINLPDININTPNITAPDVNINTPNITAPDVNITTPNITVPDVNINTPNITIPDINIPTPNINIPTPTIDVPTPNINIPTPNINVPVTPVTPVTPTTPDEDFFIDPMAVDKVPVATTTTTTNTWTGPSTSWSSSDSWSASNSWSSGSSGSNSWSGNTATVAATNDDAFIDPSVTSAIPVATTVPTSSSTYWSSGSTTGVTSPSSLRSSSDYSTSGTPLLGSDPATWSPYPLGYTGSSTIDAVQPVA